jgi:hypothetical protein
MWKLSLATTDPVADALPANASRAISPATVARSLMPDVIDRRPAELRS